MKKKPVQPSVYAYNNFRTFLADYQTLRQEHEEIFSKSEFSRLLDLPNTRSYFTDVLKGKKVTGTFVERFIRVIGFSPDEARFFRTLVRFNQAETTGERELAFEQLIDLNKTPSRILDRKMLEYYSQWYHSVIRALLETDDFIDDYPRLGRKVRPVITAAQAKKAVELLLSLGLVRRNDDGIIKPAEKAIRAPENLHHELIRNYQLEVLSLAQKKLMSGPAEVAFSLTNTISLSETGAVRLQRLLEKFRGQVRSLVHKDENKPDRVFQLSTVVMNVSRQENL